MSNFQNSQGPKRLPTHRQNRDLTLGGDLPSSGPPLFQPKRTFVPNFNAKKKPNESTSNESSETVKSQSDDKSNKFRDSRKSNPTNQSDKKERFAKAQYVQSYSMFAQGAGAVTNAAGVGVSNRPSSGPRVSTSVEKECKESSSSINTSAPNVVFKKEAKADPDKDCFVADLKSGLFPPVRLPFEAPIKSESKVNVSSSGDATSSHSHFINPTTGDFLFGSNAEGRLFSLQLPKILPSPSAVTYAAQLTQNIQNGGSSSEDNASNEKPAMDLSSFPEGKIGKLQLLRNGKVRLLIGECSFDVDYGFSHPHLVDLGMFTPPQNSDEFGEVSILGHINHKVIMRPRVEDLINAKYSLSQKSRLYHTTGDQESDSEPVKPSKTVHPDTECNALKS